MNFAHDREKVSAVLRICNISSSYEKYEYIVGLFHSKVNFSILTISRVSLETYCTFMGLADGRTRTSFGRRIRIKLSSLSGG